MSGLRFLSGTFATGTPRPRVTLASSDWGPALSLLPDHLAWPDLTGWTPAGFGLRPVLPPGGAALL